MIGKQNPKYLFEINFTFKKTLIFFRTFLLHIVERFENFIELVKLSLQILFEKDLLVKT